jgi:hypothetical protein
MVFPISLAHDTLAVIGTHRNFGPSAPTFELQSRLVARVMAGRHKLPSRDVMKRDVDRENEETFRLSGGYKYQVCELWLEQMIWHIHVIISPPEKNYSTTKESGASNIVLLLFFCL